MLSVKLNPPLNIRHLEQRQADREESVTTATRTVPRAPSSGSKPIYASRVVSITQTLNTMLVSIKDTPTPFPWALLLPPLPQENSEQQHGQANGLGSSRKFPHKLARTLVVPRLGLTPMKPLWAQIRVVTIIVVSTLQIIIYEKLLDSMP